VRRAYGEIIPDMLIVNGLEERHAEGTYCICFYNPKLTWQKCGRKPMDAVAAAERQRALFKAMEHGIVQRPTKTQIAGTMDEAVSEYLAELEARVGNGSKRPRTYATSKQILREFQAYSERRRKKSLSKITKLDPLNWWLHRWRSTYATLSLREGMGRPRSAVCCPAQRRCALATLFRRWFGQSSCRSMLDAPATSTLKFVSIELKRPAYFVGMPRRVTR